MAWCQARRAKRLGQAEGVRFATMPDGRVNESIDRRTPDGKLVSLFRDVTQERRASQALEGARDAAESAARIKSQFLAAMSHEIRTPLNAVLGMNGLLQDTPLNELQRKYVGLMATAGESLLAIINDILDLSKIEAGKFVLDDTDVNPAALVARVAALLEPRLDPAQVHMQVSVPSLPTGLKGDPTRLQQALLNYASNAVKFTEAGTITLGLRVVDEDADGVLLRFEVRDTGIGIEAEVLPRLLTRRARG